MRRISPLIALGLMVGCGLISSDVLKITFNLPPRSYDINATAWNLPSGTVPSIPCTDASQCCTAIALVMPQISCASLTCDAPTGTCAVTATIETPPQMVNLKQEVPALSGVNQQTLADVTINKITYDIDPNSLNVELPQVELFVANAAAANTSDPSAKRFGVVPPTPAGTTLHGAQVTLDPAGQDAFVGYAKMFSVPFVFISKVTVVLPGGTPFPTGDAVVSVTGQISVKPSL